MNKQIQRVIAGAAVVVAMGAIGLGVVGSAQAQSTKSSTVTVLNSSKGPGKNVAAIASILKLTEAELKTQVQSGKTLAQIATAQGVDIKLVVDAIVADMKSHIADEVKSGEITQAQADTKLADVTAKATERVNNVRPARGEGMRGGPKGPSRNVAAIASVLKLTEAELKTQVESGKTLAQIATAQGVDVKLVVDAIVADMKSHIAEEVASGELTQAQADAKLADATTKVTEMVNTVQPARGEGMQGHGRRGHHNKSETAPNA
jgi:DNA-binding CsgD family transcriptional regulator